MLNSRSLVGVVCVGVLVAALYAPTLATPFDFIDDGNLVYPAPPGTTFPQHVARWWDRVIANYEHLGPVRPVLWMHWELFANITGGDAMAWRAIRLVWCAFAAIALLALLREFHIHGWAALIVAALSMWNPFRNEIWTSLTLAEGVAMPYALLALIAARRGATSVRPWVWDVVAMTAVMAALGCKNTYLALIPPMLLLRSFRDGQFIRAKCYAALLYLLPAVLPVIHFVYFKLNWHPGQYETHGPSLAQLLRELNALKGAMSLDYLGAGIVLAIVCVLRDREARPASESRFTSAVAVVLLVCGVVVYLPMNMMSGRYTMPAVWGLDVLLGVLLMRLNAVPRSWRTQLTYGALGVGIVVLGCVNLARQEKSAARSHLLWDVVHHLEAHAPPNAVVAWISGDSTRGELNVEEGIHVSWHLKHRGRGDIRIVLLDRANQPIARVELPAESAPPQFRVVGAADSHAAGELLSRAYQFGRKRFECCVERVATAGR